MSIYLKTGKVLPEWTDYNGHMNLAFYIHLFDSSWEVLLEKFNIGEHSAKNEKRTTFAVESHTTYDMEVKVNDEVDMNLLFLDFDKKRLVYKLEMIHKKEKYLACELLTKWNGRMRITGKQQICQNTPQGLNFEGIL